MSGSNTRIVWPHLKHTVRSPGFGRSSPAPGGLLAASRVYPHAGQKEIGSGRPAWSVRGGGSSLIAVIAAQALFRSCVWMDPAVTGQAVLDAPSASWWPNVIMEDVAGAAVFLLNVLRMIRSPLADQAGDGAAVRRNFVCVDEVPAFLAVLARYLVPV